MQADRQTRSTVSTQIIREVISQYGRLSVDLERIEDGANLYNAGLTSLATVNIMLALENRFDVEFPDNLLSRKTFESIASLSDAIGELTGKHA